MSVCTCGHGFAKNERFCPRCGSLRPDAPAVAPPPPTRVAPDPTTSAAPDAGVGRQRASSALPPSSQAGAAGITEGRSGLPHVGSGAPSESTPAGDPGGAATAYGDGRATAYGHDAAQTAAPVGEGEAPRAARRQVNATLLREGCGAFLLLAALFQSWSLMHRAGWPVSVLVILAAFAIPVLNHLGRLTGAAPPPSVTIRLLPALPMALLILFTAIRELTGDDLAGAGMALAAAGTLLFLQAAFAGSPARADRWLRVGIGLLGATALWSVYVVVRAVLDYGQVADRSVIAGLVMIAVYGIGLPGWFMIRTAKRASADWAAGCLLGAAVILVLMTSGATPVTLFFVALTMGLIALSDDSLLPRMQPPLTGADRWLLPALGVITVGSLTFSYLALGRLVGLLVGDARSAGSAVILIVCAGMAIFGFACRSHAGRGSSQTRLLMLGWAAAVVVLFLVNLALTSRVRVGGPLPMNFWALVGPLLIGAAVTLPASVRRLGPLQG